MVWEDHTRLPLFHHYCSHVSTLCSHEVAPHACIIEVHLTTLHESNKVLNGQGGPTLMTAFNSLEISHGGPPSIGPLSALLM